MLHKIRTALQQFSNARELTVEDGDFEAAATELLRGHVFHVTAAHSLPQIVGMGAILPNSDGRFRSPFSQSTNSYGVKRGYVCLFDFRKPNKPHIPSAFECFLGSAVAKYARWPSFLTIDSALYDELITSDTAQRETGGAEVWVPYVECWYPRAISLQAIASATVIRVKRRPFDHSPAAYHARSIESFWRKRRLAERRANRSN